MLGHYQGEGSSIHRVYYGKGKVCGVKENTRATMVCAEDEDKKTCLETSHRTQTIAT
jgi:hypothetical protein